MTMTLHYQVKIFLPKIDKPCDSFMDITVQ